MVPRGLQWGRRFSTAETGTPPTQAADEDPFNGAAVSQRRKPSARCATRARSKPFNGAAVSQRRKLRSAAHRGRAAPPSMGPPFLNGGNGECCRPRNRQHSTFNGAAVSQRRKHPGIVGRFGGTESPSMGPPFLNGGNRKDSKRPQLGSISFNGAAVSQRRKQDTTATVQTVVFPSMGPPFLNGGN